MRVGWVTVELASVVVHGVQQSLGDNVKAIEGFGEDGVSVDIPVGAAISDHHSTKVNGVKCRVE